MKIYFNASLAGKIKYLKEYKEIIGIVKKLGNEVYADDVMRRGFMEVNKQTRKRHEADFQKIRDKIQKADAMIVEATYPSIGIGHTMTIALEMYKSVLVLTQDTPHGLLIGDPNRLLTVRKYSIKNLEKLNHIISMFFKKSEQRILKKRFNLMIDKIHEDYLGWVVKRKGLSKANFIRYLIDKSIKEKENREYIKSLL